MLENLVGPGRPRPRGHERRPSTPGGSAAEARRSEVSRRRPAGRCPPRRPGRGSWQIATIRQAVDLARPRIAAAFQNEPLIEAAVRDTVGVTYLYLGDPDEAIRQHEQAGPPRRRQAGHRPPDTLTTRNNLALAYQEVGRRAEAIKLFEATLKQRSRSSAPTTPTPSPAATTSPRSTTPLAATTRRSRCTRHAQAEGVEARPRPPQHAHSRNNLANGLPGRRATARRDQDA